MTCVTSKILGDQAADREVDPRAQTAIARAAILLQESVSDAFPLSHRSVSDFDLALLPERSHAIVEDLTRDVNPATN